jgi:hypothetical protein
MEDILTKYLDKQEYFQSDNQSDKKRFLDITHGITISDNIFQKIFDENGKYLQHLESKSYSRHDQSFSKYFYNDKIIKINHLNKNKKTLLTQKIINSNTIKGIHTHHDLLLEIKENIIDDSCIPSIEQFLHIEDFSLAIFTINQQIEIIYNLISKEIVFRIYYPINKKQIQSLSELLSDFEKIIQVKRITLFS